MNIIKKIKHLFMSDLEKRIDNMQGNRYFIKGLEDNGPLSIKQGDSNYSRLKALKAPSIYFIKKDPSQEQIEKQFDIYGVCNPLDRIGNIAKIAELFPEYANLEPKEEVPFYDKEHLCEEGFVKNSRFITIKAMFAHRGYDRYVHQRFEADSEILLCKIIARDFSLWGCDSYLDVTKHAFITPHFLEGRADYREGAAEIEMLYAIVKAERPIKNFYEQIRPKLKMTSLELDLQEQQNYAVVSQLPNFEAVMNECVKHESNKIKNNFKNLMPTFFADRLEKALPDKPPSKTKLIKI